MPQISCVVGLKQKVVYWACDTYHRQMFELLIAKGADVNSSWEGTFLFWTCASWSGGESIRFGPFLSGEAGKVQFAPHQYEGNCWTSSANMAERNQSPRRSTWAGVVGGVVSCFSYIRILRSISTCGWPAYQARWRKIFWRKWSISLAIYDCAIGGTQTLSSFIFEIFSPDSPLKGI